MFIDRETLNILADYVCGGYEICANLEESPRSEFFFKLEDIIIGEVNTCKHKQYTPYIVHTHPKNEWGYPSAEDIVKVLKNKDIWQSIIITAWGAWQISAAINEADLKPADRAAFVNVLSGLIKGYSRAAPKSTFAPAVDLEIIEETSFKIERKFAGFGLTITFTPWSFISSYLRVH